MIGRYKGNGYYNTCRLRKKYDYMNFSYEELYSMYGQYDKFVTLEFHADSETYELLGASIMGTFKYTSEERDLLELLLKSEDCPRSSNRVKFIPSILQHLTNDQKVHLDRDGILSSDIKSVLSSNSNQGNLYKFIGRKVLPAKISIPVSLSEKESTKLSFNTYESKSKDGVNLTDFEKDEYYGMLAYFDPDNLTDEDKRIIFIHDSNEMRPSIRRNFLFTKWNMEGITEKEKKEFGDFIKHRIDHNQEMLQSEVLRSNIKWDDLSIEKKMKLLIVSGGFNEEILLTGKKTVWWEIERFLHIMVRHASDLQIGNYQTKTAFQYNHEDIRELIKDILNQAQTDIEEEFHSNPHKSYKRQGKRAIYYNGNYYKVEIEPSGKLLTFHPYNNDTERDNDI